MESCGEFLIQDFFELESLIMSCRTIVVFIFVRCISSEVGSNPQEFGSENITIHSSFLVGV